jgi:hypothetical protein
MNNAKLIAMPSEPLCRARLMKFIARDRTGISRRIVDRLARQILIEEGGFADLGIKQAKLLDGPYLDSVLFDSEYPPPVISQPVRPHNITDLFEKLDESKIARSSFVYEDHVPFWSDRSSEASRQDAGNHGICRILRDRQYRRCIRFLRASRRYDPGCSEPRRGIKLSASFNLNRGRQAEARVERWIGSVVAPFEWWLATLRYAPVQATTAR